MKVTIMKVTIFGPNLPDQSQGQFHVHPKDSKAAARMAAARGHIIERFDEEVDSVQEIIEACYSDQIAESGENWKAYRADFHIHAVLLATLPYETEGCLFKEPAIPAFLPEETIDSDTKLEKAMTAMIEALAEELKVAEIESTGYSDMFRDDLRRAISSVKRIRRYY
jgi:hypothetical protein